MFATIWGRPLFVVFNTHAVVAHRCPGTDRRGIAFPSPSSRRIRPRVAVIGQYTTRKVTVYTCLQGGGERERRKGREGEGGREEERQIENSVERHGRQQCTSELVRVLKQSG